MAMKDVVIEGMEETLVTCGERNILVVSHTPVIGQVVNISISE